MFELYGDNLSVWQLFDTVEDAIALAHATDCHYFEVRDVETDARVHVEYPFIWHDRETGE